MASLSPGSSTNPITKCSISSGTQPSSPPPMLSARVSRCGRSSGTAHWGSAPARGGDTGFPHRLLHPKLQFNRHAAMGTLSVGKSTATRRPLASFTGAASRGHG
jgi:hypothetical protein